MISALREGGGGGGRVCYEGLSLILAITNIGICAVQCWK